MRSRSAGTWPSSSRGWPDRALLANYSAERVGAAREIIDEAGKSTRFMTPPSRGFQLLRDAVLSLSLTQEFVRPLYHWRTSRPHEYTHSALNSAGDDNALFRAGPAHGAPPKDMRLGSDDYLLDHLGGGFTLLYAVRARRLARWLQACIASLRARGVPLKVHRRWARTSPCRAPTRRSPMPTAIPRAATAVRGRRRLPAAPGPARVRPLADAGCHTPAGGVRTALAPVKDQAMNEHPPRPSPAWRPSTTCSPRPSTRPARSKTELFLVKLALLNANALGDPEQFRAHLASAAADL